MIKIGINHHIGPYYAINREILSDGYILIKQTTSSFHDPFNIIKKVIIINRKSLICYNIGQMPNSVELKYTAICNYLYLTFSKVDEKN